MRIESGQRLVMIGDSITDCGRARPIGRPGGLGSGYVHFVYALIAARYSDRIVEVLNTGISGNRVTDLRGRWDTDVLALHPDWLSIMIGINDVWRHYDSPFNTPQVSIGEYESILEDLVVRTQPTVKGLVLMTPYFIEANRQDPMRAEMDQFGEVVRRLARKHKTVFVDTQAAFDAYLAHRPTQTLCGDRVHPNDIGHMILAKAFLNGIGFEW